MKILHTSDLHLGLNLHGINMIDYQKKLAEVFRDIIISQNIDAMIIAGDIFDTSLASAESIQVWSELVTVLCSELKIPVIVCAGNHDGAARLSSCSELLKSAGLHIFGHLEKEIKPVIIGNTAIYAVPFFNPADTARLYECEKTTANFVMKAVLDKIRAEMDISKTNILCAHCFVSGGEVSESDTSARASAAVGGADNISVSAFDEFDYIALGHLHKAQTFTTKTGGIIRYSGTPNAYSFSEANQVKTASIFDTETGKLNEILLPQIFTLRSLKGVYDDIIEIAENDKNSDDFIKIELTDRISGFALYSKFKELYPNLLKFSGISTKNKDSKTLSAKEISELDITALFERYYNDTFSHNPDNDELTWLSQALAEI